jgi:hypothetical protein
VSDLPPESAPREPEQPQDAPDGTHGPSMPADPFITARMSAVAAHVAHENLCAGGFARWESLFFLAVHSAASTILASQQQAAPEEPET